MIGLVVIPFGLFFACCIGDFVLARHVQRALVARHPDLWLELSRKSFMIQNAVWGFAWRREDKSLNDPELSRSVDQLMILWAIGVGAWVVMLGLIVTGGGLAKH